MLSLFESKEKLISIVGLGYVGLPLALAFAKKYKVIGYDVNKKRINELKNRDDTTLEVIASDFDATDIEFTTDSSKLKEAHFHIITVPTPVDKYKTPNLSYLIEASKLIGEALKLGDYVVYESTVYPGCTEEDCIPVLESFSGLRLNKDFKVGYSPERINPGDKQKTVTNILKIVSGSDESSLELILKLYGSIITAGIYQAESIKVAEAAKVIENIQRDLNISLMNELALIFDRMDIDTLSVIEAAKTKWNFLPFFPGLVGGHCIGVDPYYLLYKSKLLGYDPEVILSGRRVNDKMSNFIAQKTIQLLLQNGKIIKSSKVLILGVTFKENVNDIRNSKVFDLIEDLREYNIDLEIYDPIVKKDDVLNRYGIQIINEIGNSYDACIIAVNHSEFAKYSALQFIAFMSGSPIIIDVKGQFINQLDCPPFKYWRL